MIEHPEVKLYHLKPQTLKHVEIIKVSDKCTCDTSLESFWHGDHRFWISLWVSGAANNISEKWCELKTNEPVNERSEWASVDIVGQYQWFESSEWAKRVRSVRTTGIIRSILYYYYFFPRKTAQNFLWTGRKQFWNFCGNIKSDMSKIVLAQSANVFSRSFFSKKKQNFL